MGQTLGYAAKSTTTPLELFSFERRELREMDILIDVLFCGICHSDLHVIKNEWKNTIYPVIPGHEIVGRVQKVGSGVSSFQQGDLVGVGCIIGSCQSCDNCKDHLEQYCDKGFTLVFNSKDPKDGSINYGGFSKQLVVDKSVALKIPKEFKEEELPRVAPLLCAGITTYSPLKNRKVGPGSRVGIIGLGGLGHMGIMIAAAMGAHVTLFTTSSDKREGGKSLGANEVVCVTDAARMNSCLGTLDFILNTAAASLDLNKYLRLLKRDGTMCLVGLPPIPHGALSADSLINKRRSLAGSLIGSIKETQEMLDFCAKHHVLAHIELLPMDRVNEAFDRLIKKDVKYRFVLDVANS